MIGMDDVKQLLTQTDERTLTLYVAVDNALQENQAATPAWKSWTRQTLTNLDNTLNAEQQESLPYIREWVSDFIETYEPTSKGLIIVAGSSFQHTFEVPFAFDNQWYFGKPQVGPLLWMIDEYEPYLITLVDQEKARFFVTYLGDVGFQEGIDIDIDEYDFAERTHLSGPITGANRGITSPMAGSGKDYFQDTLDEHHARFYRETIAHMDKLMKQHNTRRVILGGSEQSAHAVQNLMDEKMKAAVVTIAHIPLRLNSREIFDQVLPKALDYERQQELELVKQVIDFAKSRGRGALGMQAVREALDMQRVELLVLVWPMQDEELGNELAFRALQLNSNIELVHGEAADLLQTEGGIAARLYYAM